MAASVFIRMAVALVVFVMLARGLGPKAYGFIATVFAYSTLASLLTDFGFASKTLRDIAAHPDRGGEILNASLSVKGYLTAAVMIAGGVALLIMPAPVDVKIASAMLGAGVLLAAVGDLALTTFRAVGRYFGETWITGWTSLVHLVILGPIALLHGNMMLVGGSFLASRTLYAAIAIFGAEKLFAHHRFRVAPFSQCLTTMKSAWSWAADSGLNFLNSQIDTILISQTLGLTAVGVYQAGGRVIQASLTLSTILAGINLPRIAGRAGRGERSWSVLAQPLLEYVITGLAAAAIIVAVGPLFQKIALGHRYADVNKLWLGFAYFVFFRYAAGGFGVVLMGYGRAGLRVASQAVATVFIIAATPLLKSHGVTLMPWIMGTGGAITTVLYIAATAVVMNKPMAPFAKLEAAANAE